MVGAFMLVRREAILAGGLARRDILDVRRGPGLGQAHPGLRLAGLVQSGVTVTHIKEAASRHSYRARVEFYRALILFYEKHYRADHALVAGLADPWRRRRSSAASICWPGACGATGAGVMGASAMKRTRLLFALALVLIDADMSLLAFYIAYACAC